MNHPRNPGRRPMHETCPVDECRRPARHWAGDLHVCSMHWKRWTRRGSFETVRVVSPPRPARGTCVVDGCSAIDEGPRGLCKKHATRQRRHGDPLKVVAPAERQMPTGSSHPRWTGNDATYAAVHLRLRSTRGSARGYSCVDCGGRASQWSVNRSAESLVDSTDGPYSTDLTNYDPRCVPYHKAYDLGWIGAQP